MTNTVCGLQPYADGIPAKHLWQGQLMETYWCVYKKDFLSDSFSPSQGRAVDDSGPSRGQSAHSHGTQGPAWLRVLTIFIQHCVYFKSRAYPKSNYTADRVFWDNWMMQFILPSTYRIIVIYRGVWSLLNKTTVIKNTQSFMIQSTQWRCFVGLLLHEPHLAMLHTLSVQIM